MNKHFTVKKIRHINIHLLWESFTKMKIFFVGYVEIILFNLIEYCEWQTLY